MALLRLSELLLDRRAFGDRIQISLFHGTSSKHEQSFLTYGPRILDVPFPKDFGKGFYTTTFFWQAARFAKSVSAPSETPIVVCFTTTLGNLRRCPPARTLTVDEYDTRWAECILLGRKTMDQLQERFDWICGRCADKDIAHLRLTSFPESASEFLNQIRPSKNTCTYHFEQLWFGNQEIMNTALTMQCIIRV